MTERKGCGGGFYSVTAVVNAITTEREPEGPAAAVWRSVALPVRRPREPPTHLEICRRRRAHLQLSGSLSNIRIQQVN